MQITTVLEYSAKDFDEEVNALLSKGWELHGAPAVSATVHQDTWDGRLRSSQRVTFVQILKKN
jgi:hypothetical protein